MKDDDDVKGRDSWGDLNQPRQQPAPISKRERQATAPFIIERPSNKMITVGQPAEAVKPQLRSTKPTLMGEPYTPPARTTEPVSRTFKRPTDSPRPSTPSSAPEPVTQPILLPEAKVPSARQRFIAWLMHWYMTRWLARLLGQ